MVFKSRSVRHRAVPKGSSPSPPCPSEEAEEAEEAEDPKLGEPPTSSPFSATPSSIHAPSDEPPVGRYVVRRLFSSLRRRDAVRPFARVFVRASRERIRERIHRVSRIAREPHGNDILLERAVEPPGQELTSRFSRSPELRRTSDRPAAAPGGRSTPSAEDASRAASSSAFLETLAHRSYPPVS